MARDLGLSGGTIAMTHASAIRHYRPYRDAFTLIEVVVVISIMAIMLGILSVVLQRVLRSEARLRTRLTDSVAVGRLADRFRRDVHSAHAVSIDAEGGSPSRLNLTTERATIDYSQKGRYLRRSQWINGQPAGGDRYPLFADCTVAFDIRVSEGHPMVLLQFHGSARTSSATSRGWPPLVAHLGMDLRWSEGSRGAP